MRSSGWSSDVCSAELNKPNGDRCLILGAGRRYDVKPGKPDFRLFDFAQYGFRIESKNGAESLEAARLAAERKMKARPTLKLMGDNTKDSLSQIMWSFALPLAALNLAQLAIHLGSFNRRLGRSGDFRSAGLVEWLRPGGRRGGNKGVSSGR